MPAHRKSLAALAQSGTLAKNPGRYEARVLAANPAAAKGIGRAPVELNREQKAIWREIIRIAPAGTLQRADRIALEMMCRIVHQVRFSTPKLGEIRFVQTLLGKFYMNPLDRSRGDLEPQPTKEQSAADEAVYDALSELD